MTNWRINKNNQLYNVEYGGCEKIEMQKNAEMQKKKKLIRMRTVESYEEEDYEEWYVEEVEIQKK